MAEFSDFVKQLSSDIQTMSAPIQLEKDVEKTLKIMIVSTHCNQINGYSKVVYNMIKGLVKVPWVRVVHFGTQKMKNADIQRQYPDGVKVIDGTSLEKEKSIGFAFSELPGTIKSEKPDVVLLYNDLSVISMYIAEIKKAFQTRPFQLWTYVDTSYSAQSQQYIDMLNRDVERVFCFTKSWKHELKAQGVTRPIDIMNHGIDTSVYRPIAKELARKSMGLPADIFLFTSFNRNQPRKRIDLLIMAFVKLIVQYPTKSIFMMLLGDKGTNGGYNVFDIFARELRENGGSTDVFGNRLLLVGGEQCYKDDDMNILYNIGDVGVSCAEGEGFGLCSFEQMAVGVPQVVPRINGYTEYCTDENSILVAPRYKYYLPSGYNPIAGEAHVVDVGEYSKALERYVFDEGLRKQHGEVARNVCDYTWEKAVGVLVKRLERVLNDDE
jgi:glycosyltransferase involved in cell wall biosynthesis